MRILIAIDDTDNHQSRGTGYRARKMSEALKLNGLAETIGITRHQLLVHKDIPYTTHNSSACVAVEGTDLEKITYICRTFLLAESAPGSDAGLCVVPEGVVNEEVIAWGWRAKKEVLTKEDALDLAKRSFIYLEGLTGTHGGVIGSLAAVGLVTDGNDGRYLWVDGMRKYLGVMAASDVLMKTGVDKISTMDGGSVPAGARIMMHEWWRPLLKGRLAVLYVEPTESKLYEYEVISKNHIKRLSN